MSKRSLVDSIEVKKPCSEDWDKMTGNDKVRFCGHCALHVNNISTLTRKQAMKLVRESDGRICVRYVKNPVDNTPVFAEKLYKITRRAGIAAGVLGASLSLSTLTYAQGETKSDKSDFSVMRINQSGYFDPIDKEKDDEVKAESPTGSISGTITDIVEAAIPFATVKVTGKNYSATITADGEGKFTFVNLLPDLYTLEFITSNFINHKRDVRVIAEEETVVNVTLEFGREYVTLGELVVTEYASPLFQAVSENNPEEVKNLIAKGANVNEKDENYNHITPLFLAVENGNAEIAETLLSFGAKVNARDDNKQTPLMRLDDDATPELVRVLLKYGAKANLVDKEENNALILASSVVKTEVLQILIAETKNINAQNKDGRTALMQAAEEDNLENVRALLIAGADVNLKDKDGETAWDLTTNDEIESLLESYGAVTEEN